jgi:Flp pilus assembly pilin Flp
MEVPAITPVTRLILQLRSWLLRLACRAQLATLHQRQDGISMAEYILMAAAVLIIALAAINGFFNAIARAFERLTQRLDSTG